MVLVVLLTCAGKTATYSGQAGGKIIRPMSALHKYLWDLMPDNTGSMCLVFSGKKSAPRGSGVGGSGVQEALQHNPLTMDNYFRASLQNYTVHSSLCPANTFPPAAPAGQEGNLYNRDMRHELRSCGEWPINYQ